MLLRLLVEVVSIHVLCGQEVPATDDVLAMLQNSLRVNQPSQDAEAPELEEGGVPNMNSISSLEALVMARVREGKLMGDNNLSKSINASIKTYKTGIISTTAANQKTINDDLKAFSKCKVNMWKKYDKVILVERDHWIMGEIYPKCIKAEKLLKLKKSRNDQAVKTYKNNLKVIKRLTKVEEDKCTNVCTNNKNENYNEQLDRLVKYYKDCKKKIGPKVAEVNKLNKKLKNAIISKKLSDGKYDAMVKKCKKIAYIMNNYKCKAVKDLDASCSFYEACWKRAKKTYDKDRTIIEKQEKEMKIEWRALTRIQCYLKVLDIKNDKDNKKEKAQLDKCIAIKRSDISTKHLDINYGEIPKKPECPRDPMCPCSKMYTNAYYKVGPKSRCVKNIVKKYICPACRKYGR